MMMMNRFLFNQKKENKGKNQMKLEDCSIKISGHNKNEYRNISQTNN